MDSGDRAADPAAGPARPGEVVALRTKLRIAGLLALLSVRAAALERVPPAARLPFVSSGDYQRAIALDLAGRFRDALARYEREARRRGGGRAAYHLELSRGILESLDHVRRFPQDGRAHFRLGVDAANKLTALRRETGVVARQAFRIAERAFREAERLLPGRADPVICLAGLYADAGEPGKARATIARIQGRPLTAGERYNLACYHHSMGEYDKALAELRVVINDHYRRWILVSDDFWRLRGDPRLEQLLKPAVRRRFK